MTGNVNVNVVPSGISVAMIEAMSSIIGSTLKSQYASMGVPEENMTELGMLEFGENRFYGFEVNIYGAVIDQFITADGAGNQFTISFTNYDPEGILQFLTTFSPVQ